MNTDNILHKMAVDFKQSLLTTHSRRIPKHHAWLMDGKLTVVEIHSTTQEEDIKMTKDLYRGFSRTIGRNYNSKNYFIQKSSRQRVKSAIYHTLNKDEYQD